MRPYYEIKFRPLHDETGRQVGTYQFVTDVTERLRQEAQLIEAQIALRQSQKMEAIGQLTGGVAHDFNNLLMPILGNLELLRKYLSDDPRTARLIDGAVKGAQRGAALTQRLLAFARRQDLTVAPTDLSELLRNMTELLEQSLGGGVELRVVLPETASVALVDANQLELAILNLAVNARDAMPNGGVLAITVDLRPGDGDLAPGRYARLAVSDTGHGMDENTLKKATEPFFSTKGVGKGNRSGPINDPRARRATERRPAPDEQAGARHMRRTLASHVGGGPAPSCCAGARVPSPPAGVRRPARAFSLSMTIR